jgi:hypothetical protein
MIQQIIQAQEITYLSNLEQPSAGSLAIGSDSWVAGLFGTGNNADGYVLNSIQLGMGNASGNPSGFTVMVYSATRGSLTPESNLGTLDGSANPSTAGIYIYTPTTDVTLSRNTVYDIVLTSETAVANGAYEWSYGSHAGNNTYNPIGGWNGSEDPSSAGGFLYTSTDGLSWNEDGFNPQFAINATAIPEPSASFLLLLGGGIFIYVHNRKRQSA